MELALAALSIATCLAAIQCGVWAVAFHSALFGTGLLFSSGLTISQTLRTWWTRRRYAGTVPVTGPCPAGQR